MIDFSTLQGLTIPEGVVTQITDASGRVLWAAGGGKVILEVEKITSDTYAGETTYTGEQFILLDIYPTTNGTVNVTYGGLTKTITDTSGAEKPNAQRVYFGTFNGVSDSVATPASGELTIEGKYYALGCSVYEKSSKDLVPQICFCVTRIENFGKISIIPDYAFGSPTGGTPCQLGDALEIPSGVKSIGFEAFYNCGIKTLTIGKNVEFIGYLAFGEYLTTIYTPVMKTVKILATTPPEVGTSTGDGEILQRPFTTKESNDFVVEQIIVPKGSGNAYKTAAGWSEYADLIVEAS